MAESSHVLHEIHPVFNTDSRILILGSFPSVKSRESQFFYGHPRNRFWNLIATLTDEPLPVGIEEKITAPCTPHCRLGCDRLL